MKTRKFIFLFIGLVIFIPLLSLKTHNTGKRYYYAFSEKRTLILQKNKLLVKFSDGFIKKDIEEYVSQLSPESRFEWQTPYVATVSSNSAKSVENILKNLKQRVDVVSCYPFYETEDSVEMGVTNEIIVSFLPGVTEEQKAALQDKYGTKEVKTTPIYEVLTIPEGSDPLVIANSYYESGLTKFSTPDFYTRIIFHQIIPNDPYFHYQITCNNIGQTINDGHHGIPDADIDAPEAWELTTGNSDIVIAVLDQGVTSNHPDLPNSRQVRLSGSDFFQGDGDPSPEGNYNHGNACAGVIAATMNNHQGIAGIAPNCKIMPIRIAKSDDQFVSNNTIASAIEFAVDHGADILSNSWGYGSSDPNFVKIIVTAIQYAVDHGCVVVFSAGNTADNAHGNNGYISFPANVNIPGVITVGASDRYDHQANYSPTSDPSSNENQIIDIVAPSHRAYPCRITGETFEMWTIDIPDAAGYNSWHVIDTCMNPPPIGEQLPNSGTNYLSYTGRFGGTSHSCPVVAGVAALVLSADQSLTYLDVFDILTATADEVGGYTYTNEWSDELGYGRVNACRVVFEAYSRIMYVTGPSLVCTSNSTFTLQNTPSGSTVTWSVSPGTHVMPYSGNGSSATFHLSSCNSIGNEQVTFTISNSCGTIQVSKTFIAGGPDPTDVNLDVWLSSGQHANKYGLTWVLCPNENYEIFVINNSSCTTSNYTWILPPSLTRNYAYNNMISVHTNSHPGGNIIVKAQTCCSGCGSNVQILSDYVGTDYNCGYGYMSFTPNPTADETTLELKTENIEKYTVGDEWSLEIVNRQQVIIQKTTNLKDKKYVINTSGWKEGLYFVRVMIHNNMYSGKFVVAR